MDNSKNIPPPEFWSSLTALEAKFRQIRVGWTMYVAHAGGGSGQALKMQTCGR